MIFFSILFIYFSFSRNSPRRHRTSTSSSNLQQQQDADDLLMDDREMLWRLVDEAETNLVAYSEEVKNNLF